MGDKVGCLYDGGGEVSGGHNEPHGRVFYIHTLCFDIQELHLAPLGWEPRDQWFSECARFAFVPDQSNDKDSIQSYSVFTTHSIKTTKTHSIYFSTQMHFKVMRLLQNLPRRGGDQHWTHSFWVPLESTMRKGMLQCTECDSCKGSNWFHPDKKRINLSFLCSLIYAIVHAWKGHKASIRFEESVKQQQWRYLNNSTRWLWSDGLKYDCCFLLFNKMRNHPEWDTIFTHITLSTSHKMWWKRWPQL